MLISLALPEVQEHTALVEAQADILMKADFKIVHDAGTLWKLWLIDLFNILCLHEGQSALGDGDGSPDGEGLHSTMSLQWHTCCKAQQPLPQQTLNVQCNHKLMTYIYAARTRDPAASRSSVFPQRRGRLLRRRLPKQLPQQQRRQQQRRQRLKPPFCRPYRQAQMGLASMRYMVATSRLQALRKS